MEFSRQEYWSGLFFSPGDFPDPGSEPWSPAVQADFLSFEPPGKPVYNRGLFIFCFFMISAVSCLKTPTLRSGIQSLIRFFLFFFILEYS